MPVNFLDNTTVIECATVVTAPYATALRADLGALLDQTLAASSNDKK